MEGRRNWDGVPLGESHSPPQSVPGRRTPLGAVGLGGFYMQGGQPPPPPQHCYPTDENQPEPGTSYGPRLVQFETNKKAIRTSLLLFGSILCKNIFSSLYFFTSIIIESSCFRCELQVYTVVNT